MTPLPSQKYLLECFQYNPDSGELSWNTRPPSHFSNLVAYKKWCTRRKNSPTVINALCNGYYGIRLDGPAFYVHRLIWKLAFGEDPSYIDHINNNKLDNRLSNLRQVTHSLNNHNRPVRKDNKLQVKGVYQRKDTLKFQAEIRVNKQKINLGCYTTLEDAQNAYQTGIVTYYGSSI